MINKATEQATGLEFAPYFCPADVDPFSTVEWDRRTAEIKGENGEVIFEQHDCEVPKQWSNLATNVVVSKYFYGEPGTSERETSVRQVIHRVARTIADWGIEDGYFASQQDGENFYRELAWLCLHQHGAFNSPVWFNVGLFQQYGVKGPIGGWRWDSEKQESVRHSNSYEYPQGSACFIQSVEDNMEDIMRLATSEAMLFKFGSGTGTDLSTIRSSREKISGGGTPSGPLSFMRIYDAVASVIKSGGVTRRSAKMQSIKDWHPDVLEFIRCKSEEERKARTLIESGKYDANFNGEAYGSVMFQNANLSVRLSDEFMQAVKDDADWQTKFVTDQEGEPPVYKARELMREMAEGAWYCGDPGVQYDTTINDWHTVPNSGRINASNPCCFIGETLVETSEGFVQIETLAHDYEQGKVPPSAKVLIDGRIRSRQIKRAWKSGYAKSIVHLEFDNGVKVSCTPEHRFLTNRQSVAYLDGYVPACELKRDDSVFSTKVMCAPAHPSHDNSVQVERTKLTSIRYEKLTDPVPVYDIEVEDVHHFFVRDEDTNATVIAHNSEYMHLDDSACNLASINLRKMQQADGTFDVERFRNACRVFITAQEIIVDRATYPTAKIAENSHKFRPLGLGYANLGSLLMSMGIPYDSDEGRGICGAITAIMHGQAYLTSAEIAEHKGAFEGFELNREPMLRVLDKHYYAVNEIHDSCPEYLLESADGVLDDACCSGESHGFRNAQVTVLAPTGTIAFMMDCDTTGIEPDIALVKYKQLAGGGMMKIVNRTVPLALERLGYDECDIDAIVDRIEQTDTIEGDDLLKSEHLPVFDCAFKAQNGKRSIEWQAHVKMMAAAQPFLSGAISKTVNMPTDSTPEDIEHAYMLGWELGLKALAVYRDGSKQSQPLSTSTEGDKKKASEEPSVQPATPARRRLPETRQSLTHKFSIAGHEGYITVGLFEDGSPGELFVTMSKEGSTIGGLMDCIGTQTSMGLQYGVPLEVFVNKFTHVRFEPSGWTENKRVPHAKSIVDYIFRWLGETFMGSHLSVESQEIEQPAIEPAKKIETREQQFSEFQSDAPACSNCGSITVRNGNCYLCHNCGTSMGCS